MESTELIDKVKNYLDITWYDELTEKKVKGLTERAIKILQSYAGTEIDLDEDSDEEQLLLDLCRYIYNNAYEDFKINFCSELIMLRVKYQCEEASEINEQKKSTNF